MYYLDTNQKTKVNEVLDYMNKKISSNVIEIDYRLLSQIGNIYYSAGNYAKFKEISAKVEKEALKSLENNPNDLYAFRILLNLYQNLNDNYKLLGLWENISKLYPGDQNVKANIKKYKRLIAVQDSLNKVQPKK